MTPTQVATRLKKIYHRKFRSEELTVYAQKLELKRTNGKSGGNLSYFWNESDIEKLKNLIE